jgi:hypothetical protein
VKIGTFGGTGADHVPLYRLLIPSAIVLLTACLFSSYSRWSASLYTLLTENILDFSL